MLRSSLTLKLSFKLHFLLLRFCDVALRVKDNYGWKGREGGAVSSLTQNHQSKWGKEACKTDSSNFHFRGTVKKPQILLAYLCYFNMLDLITLNINTIFWFLSGPPFRRVTCKMQQGKTEKGRVKFTTNTRATSNGMFSGGISKPLNARVGVKKGLRRSRLFWTMHSQRGLT